MDDEIKINSQKYWNNRFRENWVSLNGPVQSRFFAKLAIENLPDWLFKQINRQSLTFIDWGCAQGDGTDLFASLIDTNQLTGVDFSQVAIDEASQRYPGIRFLAENWLDLEEIKPYKYDIIFSSNTLEHFYQPYRVLDVLTRRAKKAIILVLPYCELDRIEEHFFSFLPDNIPLVISNAFRLVWSCVVDCRSLKIHVGLGIK